MEYLLGNYDSDDEEAMANLAATDMDENELLDHQTIIDLLTPSDIAYSLWQLVNSHGDWDNKLELTGDGAKVDKYKCNARWTSNRKLPAMEDRTEDDAGMKFYIRCLKWAKDFKLVVDKRFTVALNKKCMKLGYYKMPEVNQPL